MIKFLKPLSFLPALCLMYMIFTFSAQDGVSSSQLSYKVSYKLIETGGEILGADFEPWEIDSLACSFYGSNTKNRTYDRIFCTCSRSLFSALRLWGCSGIWLMLACRLYLRCLCLAGMNITNLMLQDADLLSAMYSLIHSEYSGELYW